MGHGELRAQFIFGNGEAVLGSRQSKVWKLALSSEAIMRMEIGLAKTVDRRRKQDVGDTFEERSNIPKIPPEKEHKQTRKEEETGRGNQEDGLNITTTTPDCADP